MIPVLFETNEKTFTSNGIGRLSDSISCYVFEERNGAYELELEYPISGSFFNELKNDRIILANPSDGKQSQPFRIFKISKPISGIVTVYAKHISYDLSGIPVAPFSATSCSGALNGLIQNSMIPNEFSVWTDISSSGNFNMKSPSSFRNKLGGEEGSILQKFGNGAELDFDRFIIKVFNHRGSDNGVTIRYGKNLTDLKQEESVESVWTGAVGYWFKEDTETNTSELVSGSAQYIPNHADYPRENLRVLDFTSYFDSKPTVAQLNSRTVEFINSNKFGIPKVSIDIAFANLWQTEEFSSLSTLERVKLCDTVHVIFEDLGVNATAKVIKTEYDVLKDSYSRISLGEARTSFAESIQENTFEKVQPIIKSALETAISNATEQIAGSINMSGYVTQIKDGNGNWSELVISDNADYTKATNVWRWTQGGLGFSSNGYAGPYSTAITADGHINGQMITAGSINASTINIGARTLTETIFDLTETSKGSIKGTKQYYLQTVSADKPSKNDSGWTTTKPSTIVGQHMWYMLVDITANGSEIRHEPFELTGIKGESGRGIVGSPTLTYQAGTSATVIPTGTWSSDIPLVAEGYTLWTKTTWKYSDNTTSEVYTPSIAGKAGRGVKRAEPQYYLSTSKTELAGGEWSNMHPEKTKDTWIWMRYRTVFTDGSVGYSDPVKDDALNGLIDVTVSNKSSIEQLNNSINLSVQERTKIKNELKSAKENIDTLETQSKQYATKAELQLTKDGIAETISETVDDKTRILKQFKRMADGMHIQGADGSVTEMVLDEKSLKLVANGKEMVNVNSTETRVQSLKAEGNFATGSHKFKRGMMKEISGEVVACTNIYWIGGE